MKCYRENKSGNYAIANLIYTPVQNVIMVGEVQEKISVMVSALPEPIYSSCLNIIFAYNLQRTIQ
jgi:hypothetical protein